MLKGYGHQHSVTALGCALFAASLAPEAYAQGGSTPAPGPSQPPACSKSVSVALGAVTTVAATQRAVVTVSGSATAACLVAGFPGLARAADVKNRLNAARLSLPSSATVAAGSSASFVIRYASAPGGSGTSCTLAVFVNDTGSVGSLILPRCEPLAAIAVSSYAPGPSAQLDVPDPGPTPLGQRSTPRCRAADLVLRDAGSGERGSTARETIAVQNRGSVRCVLLSNERIVLFDAAGQPLAYSGPAASAAAGGQKLVLESGYEASLTLSFAASADTKRCPPLRSVVLAVPDGNVTAAASDTLAPCPTASGPALQTSPLRPGIPLGD